jgi:O-antigen/teichoic acid export membrane protein
MKEQQFSNFIPFMIAQIIGSGATYFLHIFLGRFLGIAGYGFVAIFWAIINVISTTLSFGIPQFVARYIAGGDGVVDFANSFIVQLFLVQIVALVTLVPWLFTLDLSLVLVMISLCEFFALGFSSTTIAIAYFNGTKQYIRQAFLYTLISVTRFAASVFLVLLGLGYFGAFVGITASPILSLLVSYYLLKDSLKFQDKKAISIRKQLTYVFPVTAYGFGFSIMMNSPILALVITNAQIDSIGLLQASLMLASIGYAILASVNNVIFPEVSSSQSTGTLDGINALKASIKIVIVLVFVALPIVALFSSEIIVFIFTTSFIGAVPFLFPLVLSMIFMSLLSIGSTTLIAQDRSYIVAKIVCALSLISLICECFANLLIGPVGVSWVFLAFSVLGSIFTIQPAFKSFNKV